MVRGSFGLNPLSVATDLGVTTSGEDRARSVVADIGLRSSLRSLFDWDRNSLEQYTPTIDLGLSAGVGLGLAGSDLFGRAWLGAWTDIRLRSDQDGYTAIHLELRHDEASGHDAATYVLLGVDLAWYPKGAFGH